MPRRGDWPFLGGIRRVRGHFHRTDRGSEDQGRGREERTTSAKAQVGKEQLSGLEARREKTAESGKALETKSQRSSGCSQEPVFPDRWWGAFAHLTQWWAPLPSDSVQWSFRGTLPRLSGKESACQCRRHRSCRLDPWVGKSPCKRTQQLTAVFLPGEPLGQRSLGATTVHRLAESQTRLGCWAWARARAPQKHLDLLSQGPSTTFLTSQNCSRWRLALQPASHALWATWGRTASFSSPHTELSTGWHVTCATWNVSEAGWVVSQRTEAEKRLSNSWNRYNPQGTQRGSRWNQAP